MVISKTTLAMVLAAGVMAFSAAHAGTLKSHTHKVKCDKGKSLQKAVDKAHSGDTLVVSGTCTENVTIRVDQISLIGTGGAEIEPADTSVSTVTVLATNVRIRGFTITVGSNRQAIIVNRGGSARIERNTITGTGKTGDTTGILVTSNSYARIGGRNASSENDISGHRNGVSVRLGSGADIFFNDIHHNNRGISLGHGGAGDISDNLIHDNNRGLSLIANASASLSTTPSTTGGANVFENNDIGIRCALGGSLTGIPQTFISNVIDQGRFGSCPVSSALGAFTPL